MTRARQAIAGLLGERGLDKTICPSEAARRITPEGGDWRAKMGEVHAAADAMQAAGEIELTSRGRRLDRRRGAYRIARRRA